MWFHAKKVSMYMWLINADIKPTFLFGAEEGNEKS